MQLAVQLAFPEAEEPVQGGEFRRQIVFLPDIALQQPGMVRHVIQDFRRGEMVAQQLVQTLLLGGFRFSGDKRQIDHACLLHSAEPRPPAPCRSEEHTSELQSRENLVCRLLLEKKKKKHNISYM